MGVMACDRDGCTNIMCDRCILHNTMYICDQCYEELVELKERWTRTDWDAPLTIAELEQAIRDFMSTEPGTYRELPPMDLNEVFRQLTGGGDVSS